MISEFKSNEIEFGYNLSEGGKSGAKGSHWSAERRKEYSEKFSGSNHPWFGRKHSETSKQKMREWRTGWKHSEESVEKIRAFQESRKQKIVCYETRKVFSSISEASEKMSLNQCNLVEACNRFPNGTCGGYHWYRLSEYPLEYECDLPKRKNEPRKVIRLDSLNTYESVGEAANLCNLDPRHISRCCREKTRKAGGSHWRF